MWSGFDPEIQRDWQVVRGMVARQRQTPTREWPLVFDQETDLLLVVREWPDGSVTSYATSEYSDQIRGGGDSSNPKR
jgi:hypothetical protein